MHDPYLLHPITQAFRNTVIADLLAYVAMTDKSIRTNSLTAITVLTETWSEYENVLYEPEPTERNTFDMVTNSVCAFLDSGRANPVEVLPELLRQWRIAEPPLRGALRDAMMILGADSVATLTEWSNSADADLRLVGLTLLAERNEAGLLPFIEDATFDEDGAIRDLASAAPDYLDFRNGTRDFVRQQSIGEVFEDVMETCRAILKDTAYMPRGAREHLLATFGICEEKEEHFAINFSRAGYHRRTLLYAITVQELLSLWDDFCPNDHTPFIYWNLAHAVYTRTLPRFVGEHILGQRDGDAFEHEVGIDETMVLSFTDYYKIDLRERNNQFVPMPGRLPGLDKKLHKDQDYHALASIVNAARMLFIQVLKDEEFLPQDRSYHWSNQIDPFMISTLR